MIIDIEYVKIILEEFQNANTAHINSTLFSEYIKKDEEKFIFHWEILQDKMLVSGTNGKIAHIIKYGLSDCIFIGGVKLRLTDEGHQFCDALNDSEILLKLKTELKTFSMDSMINIASKMFDKKLQSLI